MSSFSDYDTISLTVKRMAKRGEITIAMVGPDGEDAGKTLYWLTINICLSVNAMLHIHTTAPHGLPPNTPINTTHPSTHSHSHSQLYTSSLLTLHCINYRTGSFSCFAGYGSNLRTALQSQNMKMYDDRTYR